MQQNRPTLFIMAGLPGTGKTTLSQMLSVHMKIPHLRIDTIEQGLRDLCGVKVVGEGYRLTYRIATDNLSLGHSVIADSCNPIQLSRDEWQEVAINAGAKYQDIEIICSDENEHRQRVETRKGSIPTLVLPTWEKVVQREYHEWLTPRIVIDTAGKKKEESFAELLHALETA